MKFKRVNVYRVMFGAWLTDSRFSGEVRLVVAEHYDEAYDMAEAMKNDMVVRDISLLLVNVSTRV